MIGSLSGGGAERGVSNLSLHLSNNIDTLIIVYSCTEADYSYNGNIIRLKPCKKNNFKGLMKKIYYLYKYVRGVMVIKNEYKPDVSVSFLPTPNLLNIISGRGGKIVLSVRNHTSKQRPSMQNKIIIYLMKLFHNHYDKIIAVSQGVKMDLVETYGFDEKKIEVIYNPYDIEHIRNLMYEELPDKHKYIYLNQIITTVGSLTYQKGQKHLIRSFLKVKKQYPNTKLVILGKGELEGELRTIVRALNLENDVFFMGFQNNPFKYIYNSTIYISPSLYEGFPNALVEAMACGIPVISSDCRSGPREILSPKSKICNETINIEYAPYGILVPVCNEPHNDVTSPLNLQEDMLADSIIHLLGDQELRDKYSKMAKKRANDFNIDYIINQWENLIYNT